MKRIHESNNLDEEREPTLLPDPKMQLKLFESPQSSKPINMMDIN
jgi:hypothetical protein